MSTKVYVGNFGWNITEDRLRDVFAMGEPESISDLIIKRERDTLRSRSYGFITYHDTEVAAKAIQTLHMSELEGRLLKVGWPVEGPIAPPQV